MGKVWVVQEVPGKNVHGARRFGELHALLPANSQVVVDSFDTIQLMLGKLVGFCDDDFLLAIGDPAAIGIACGIAAQKNDGRFKMLKWDRQEKDYYAVSIDLAAAPFRVAA